jgi:uncharacterized protein (TIGR03382 family)
MSNNNLLSAVLALASLTAAHGALAVPITPSVAFSEGTSYTTKDGIAEVGTTGYDMPGATVTASFLSGQTQSRTWAAVDFSTKSGGVTGDGWQLSLVGDSNSAAWTLLNTGFDTIVGLFIDLRPASAVFDAAVRVSDANPEGTPGSSFGSNIRDSNDSTVLVWMNGPDGLAVTGTYSNRLLFKDVFYGDLYLTLDMSFSRNGGLGGIARNDFLTFRSDTDSLATKGDISIPGNGNGNGNGGTPVPTPGTLALLGLGFAGLVTRRRGQAGR